MTNKSVLPLHTVTFIPKRVIFYRSKLFHTDFRFGSEAAVQPQGFWLTATHANPATQIKILFPLVGRQLSCNHRSFRSSKNPHCHRQLTAKSGRSTTVFLFLHRRAGNITK
jgi:hypothetical protein